MGTIGVAKPLDFKPTTTTTTTTTKTRNGGELQAYMQVRLYPHALAL